MDPTHTTQMVSWLDEEMRRQKAHISELRDLLQKQAIEMADQRKRHEDLQGRYTQLQNELARVAQVDQTIQQLKNEMAAVLQSVREEARRSDQQALQAQQLEREADARAHVELAQRVERLMTLEDRIGVLSTELQRQNEVMTGYRQRLDYIDKELARRADREQLSTEEHRRELERMDTIQRTIDSMRTQFESHSARFQYLERWAQGAAQRTAEMQAFRADMAHLQDELVESQRRSEQRVERQVREWATITENLHRDQEAWAGQLRLFAEQHERTKKALVTMQDMSKTLRIMQDEARQALDLGMEKQRRELREWQGENDKRWSRYLAQWEYRWNEQQKTDEALIARIEELETIKAPIDKELQALRAALAEQRANAQAAIIDIWRFQMEYIQRQLDITKATAEKTQAEIAQQEALRAAGKKPTDTQ